MAERVHYKTMMYDSARWDGFELRPDDIVISTPPKCGTTWMQMICALLVFQDPELPAPLSELSPWLDWKTTPLQEVLAALGAQRHRRFIICTCQSENDVGDVVLLVRRKVARSSERLIEKFGHTDIIAENQSKTISCCRS